MSTVVAKLFNAAGTQIAELPDFIDIAVQDKLNDENSWTMKYDRGGRNFSSLIQDADVSVKVFVDGTAVWEGVVEEDNWDESIEYGPVTIAGRSWAGQFEYAKVYPKGGVNSKPAEWAFVNATPGKIMVDLLNAAQARGALPGISLGFTATTDSSGNAWTGHLTIAYKAGVSLLEVLRNLGDSGLVDWRMNGKQLAMYNPRTTLGGQTGVILRRGRDIKTAPRSRSRRKLGTVYLVQGDEDATVERVDSSAVAARGRKEAFISQGGIKDPGTLSVVGDMNLLTFSNNRVSKTHSLVFTDDPGLPRPWVDYKPGQYIDTDLSGVPENYRVVAMAVSMGSDGFLDGEVTLNDLFQEREILLDSKVTSLTGGSSGSGAGTSPPKPAKDVTVPDKVYGLDADSAPYFGYGGTPYAQVTATWGLVSVNTDGSLMDDFDRYEFKYWYTSEPTLVHTINTSSVPIAFSGLQQGESLSMKVRAWDSNGHAGAYSDVLTIDLAQDTDAPPVPSTPVVENYLGLLRVTWNGLGSAGEAMPRDFKYVEVWYSQSGGFTIGDPGSKKADVFPAAASANISGLTYGTPYYVKLRSVDTLDNKSAPSAEAVGIPQQVVKTDIGNNVIDFSNIRFKDVGNLIPDGSFEYDTTAELINGWGNQFEVIDNPDGVTAAPSPKVLRINTGPSTTMIFSEDITTSPEQSYVMIFSYKAIGLTGDDDVYIMISQKLRDGSTANIGMKILDSTTNTSDWVIRQAVSTALNPAVVSLSAKIWADIETPGAYVLLDQWEFRIRQGTVLIQDAAINNAKIANLAVNDAKIQNVSAGKLTVGTLTADITVSSRIKTANTGARVELSNAGLLAYNSSGTQTVNIAAATGSVTIIGQIKSGNTGQRVEINPTSTSLPEIRFYPDSGSNFAFINGYSPVGSPSVYIGVNSGQFTANSTTQIFRLYMTDAEASLETIVSATQARLGGRVSIGPNFTTLQSKTSTNQGGYVNTYMGNPGTFNYAASIGHDGTSRANDVTLDFFQDGSMWMLGTWVREMGQPEGAIECNTFNGASTSSGVAWTWAVTKDSTVYPVWGYRDDQAHATTMDALTTSGWGVEISGASSGAFAIHWWGWR
ncbi:hypothetical protein [Streptomyces sp. NPDC006477]|uniref:hypothetical protein n=1 Tax=Streptomyces sp. NPDC006477 TaxID=3364747 RepID=UPI0036A40D14